MKCTQCDDDGAERMALRFTNGSSLVVYLCPECVDDYSRDERVSELEPTPVS